MNIVPSRAELAYLAHLARIGKGMQQLDKSTAPAPVKIAPPTPERDWRKLFRAHYILSPRAPGAARPIVRHETRPQPILLSEKIIQGVIDVTGASRVELMSRRGDRPTCEARFVVAYLMRKHGRWSTPAIGRKLQRDHSSIVYALQQVESNYDHFAPIIEAVEARL